MQRKTLFSLGLVALLGAGMAATGLANPGDRVFEGRVTCKDSGEALAGVEVTVFHVKTGEYTTGRTDAYGDYSITDYARYGGSWMIYLGGQSETVCPYPGDALRLKVGDPTSTYHVDVYDASGASSEGVEIEEAVFLILNSQPSSNVGVIEADFSIANACSPSGDFEGFTPGFWKNHAFGKKAAWGPTGLAPGDLFSTVFGCGPDKTLLKVLKTGGGGEKALGRHAVAALLNALHPNVDYAMSSGHVIDAVCDALASGDKDEIEDLKDDLDEFNNAGGNIKN